MSIASHCWCFYASTTGHRLWHSAVTLCREDQRPNMMPHCHQTECTQKYCDLPSTDNISFLISIAWIYLLCRASHNNKACTEIVHALSDLIICFFRHKLSFFFQAFSYSKPSYMIFSLTISARTRTWLAYWLCPRRVFITRPSFLQVFLIGWCNFRVWSFYNNRLHVIMWYVLIQVQQQLKLLHLDLTVIGVQYKLWHQVSKNKKFRLYNWSMTATPQTLSDAKLNRQIKSVMQNTTIQIQITWKLGLDMHLWPPSTIIYIWTA